MQSHKTALLTAFLLAFIGILACITRVQASPAAPVEITLTQPDGTHFTAFQWGDEWNNGYETASGYSILQTADGWWSYARAQADGRLAPAHSNGRTLRVGVDLPGDIPLHLRATGKPSSLRADKPTVAAPAAGPEYVYPPASGDARLLVLLAKFNDQAETYPASYFQQLVFGPGSSLKSYYQEVSYGSLNLLPAAESCGTIDDGLADWRALDYAHPNTGASVAEANLKITKDILTLNDDCIDYGIYDLDHDGSLAADELLIVVVVAGWEQAYGDAATPSIWAHSFYLDFVEQPVLDGVAIGSYYRQSYYAQVGEIHGTGSDQHAATLGVLAHEFGHLLNWPDLYDPDGSTEGVGRWSIMGAGGWNQTGTWPGDTPAHPDAWSKWYQGWLTPLEITTPQDDVPINQAEDTPEAYLIRSNPGGIDWIFNYHTGRGEYFLVENRQQTLSDAGLPGCGLLVWHIQEKLTFDNLANANEDNPLVSLEQADGLDDLRLRVNRGDAGDPYPGSTHHTVFDFLSTPDSKRHDGGISGVSMTVDSGSCARTMQADLAYKLETTMFPFINTADPRCSTWETVLDEDLEDGVLNGWTALDDNGTEFGEYYPAVTTCRADNSTHSAWLVGGGSGGSGLSCGAHYPDQALPWMIYGPFSTIGETAMKLDFSHWTYIEPAIPYYFFDRFCVWGSIDNEQYIGYCLSGDWGGWSNYSYSLKDDLLGFYDFLDQPQVWIAFSMMTDDYIDFPEGVYVDDIRLQRCTGIPGTPGCSGTNPAAKTGYRLIDAINPFRLPDWQTGPTIIGPLFHTR